MSEAKKPVLVARGLSKHFGGLTAVDNVDIEIQPGEVVALLGDNGAGKSTLIKCISGVYQPDQGQVTFNGVDITNQSPADVRSRGIETIYQDLALAENLDVGANVFLGKEKTRRLFGLIPVTDDNYMRQEASGVLDELDIHIPSLRQKLVNLSGGQRQAVAIARAMYWNAQLVIMDEPTAALGVPEQRKVLALIRSLREGAIPVILISHTMQDVMAVADRMVVMRRGKVVANIQRVPTPQKNSSCGILLAAWRILRRLARIDCPCFIAIDYNSRAACRVARMDSAGIDCLHFPKRLIECGRGETNWKDQPCPQHSRRGATAA